MSKLVNLASAVVIALTSVACGEAGGPSSSASSVLTTPSALGAASGETAATTAKGGGGGKGRPGGGGTGGSGSLTLRVISDANGNGLPDWGDSVRFDVSTSATSEPNVSLTCSQSGTVVYGAVTGYYSGYPWPWTQVMTLSSASWTGGAASCTAKLYYISGTSTVDLGSTTFNVGA
jgi:hypothetical protein